MYRILYVDDEPGLLEIGKLFLEQSGQFSVDTLSSSSAAFTLLNSKTYDAVISDYQMPGMDGIEFLKKLRTSGNTIPFILFTGRGREEVVIQALNEGADFYLQKGGEPESQFTELAHQISQAIQQRKAEASIRDLERREADIINFLPDATFAIDNNGLVIAWNRAIEEMTGVSAAEMLGKGNYEYAIPFYGQRQPILIDLVCKYDESIAKQYAHIIHKKDILIADTTLPKLKRQPVTFMVIASPLYDRQGKIVGAIESIRDITEREQAENIIRESEERYRVLVAHSQDGAFLMQDGFLQFCNEAFAVMIGYTPSEIMGLPVPSLIAPEDRDMVMKRQQDRLAGKSLTESYEFRMLHRDATTRVPVILSVGIGTYRNRPAVIGTVRDVTKEREREHALRESEEKYRALVETSFDGIIIHQDGSIIYANTTAVRLFGAGSADEIMGRPVLSFVHPEFRTVVLQRMTSATEETQPSLREKFLRIDGSVIDVDVVAIPFVWKNKPAVHVVFRDITEHKLAEEELQESEERYRNVVEDQTEFISRFLPNGTHVFVNEAYCRYFGLKRDEILGHRFRPNIPAGDQERVRQFFKSLSPNHPVDIIEHRIIMPDGNIRWQRWSDRAIFDPSGRVTEYQSVGQDITEEKATQIALEKSEIRFREQYQSNPLAIFTWQQRDGDFVLIDCNRAAHVLTSGRSNDFLGVIASEFYANRPELISEIRQCFSKRTALSKELVSEHFLPGRLIHTTAAFVPPDLIMVHMEDITEHRLAEVALQKAQKLLTTTEHVAKIGSWELDVKTQTVTWTDELYRIHEMEPGDFVPNSPEHITRSLECYDPQDRVLIQEAFERCQTEGKSYNLEFPFTTTRGRRLWIRTMATPVIEEGKVVRVMGNVLDISDLKRAEEAYRQANKKLKLLSGITRHDIDNQLMTLNGFLGLLHRKVPDPTLEDYFTRVKKASDRITSMIQFTKEYENIGVNAPIWQDCRTLIDTAAKEAPLGQVMMKNDLPAGTEVFADPLIVKVFYNLMDNAVRHGGKITTIRFSVEELADSHVVVCEDDGDGVPADEKEQIFERGFGKNTGMGLFLAREILSITGITITETGTPGKGARFEIHVPKGVYRFIRAT